MAGNELALFFQVLAVPLTDENWICVFKALRLLHIMIRIGNTEKILVYLALCPGIPLLPLNLAGSEKTDKWIEAYSLYISQKVGSYSSLKFDWVTHKEEALLMFLTVEDVQQLLKHAEILQEQIDSAIRCDWRLHLNFNIVIKQGFRYMVLEMIDLYTLGNAAIVRILKLFFRMKKGYQEKSLSSFRRFVELLYF